MQQLKIVAAAATGAGRSAERAAGRSPAPPGGTRGTDRRCLMKRVVLVLVAVGLALSAMAPVFADYLPIDGPGTEGPEGRIHSAPINGIEGPHLRVSIESKGIEDPDVCWR
jgi:hypothetical protein